MKRFRILYTSDIHCRLFASVGQPGLDYTASLLQKDGNTLLFDGGDLLQGGPVAAFLSQNQYRPHPAAAILNLCGYDAVTLGNHDFNYGLPYLSNYLSDLQALCLCANIRDLAHALPVFPTHVFHLKNGLRIGVVGLCTDALAGWERSSTLSMLAIEPPLQAARRAIASLKGRCDVLVGLYHGGFEESGTSTKPANLSENIAECLCRELPFDLLLTGHQHLSEPGRWIAGTLAVQPGCFGRQFAEIRGCLSPGGRLQLSSRLLDAPVPNEMPPATEVRTAFYTWESAHVCMLPSPLPLEDRIKLALHGSPLADFINHVQLVVSGAQISATCLAASATGLPQHVTRGDVFRTYPSANTLCTIRCSGEILRRALEWTACFLTVHNHTYQIDREFLEPKQRLFHFDFYSGIDYALDFCRPRGLRVVNLSFQGRPVCPEDTFTLCITNYRYAGGDGYDMFRSCELLHADNTPIAEHLLHALSAYKQHPCCFHSDLIQD